MKVELIGAVFLCCLGFSNALDCYGCSYNISGIVTGGGISKPECRDPFDVEEAKKAGIGTSTCSDNQCQKLVTSVGDDSGDLVLEVHRFCNNQEPCNPGCIKLGDHEGGYWELCSYCCTGDFCNSADAVHINLVVVLASVLFAILYY